MSVRIVLDHHRSLYTNLDFIQGRAILSLTRNETIAAVTVKLEGESKTRLLGETALPPSVGGMGRRTHDVTIETEVHKVCIILIRHYPDKEALGTLRLPLLSLTLALTLLLISLHTTIIHWTRVTFPKPHHSGHVMTHWKEIC